MEFINGITRTFKNSLFTKTASGEGPLEAKVWEPASRNDVALTDVSQLFISLPKSVPYGGKADTVHTHASLFWTSKTHWLDFGCY